MKLRSDRTSTCASGKRPRAPATKIAFAVTCPAILRNACLRQRLSTRIVGQALETDSQIGCICGSTCCPLRDRTLCYFLPNEAKADSKRQLLEALFSSASQTSGTSVGEPPGHAP